MRQAAVTDPMRFDVLPRISVLGVPISKRLVGPLHDALDDDVDPRQRPSLDEHSSVLAIGAIEMLTVGQSSCSRHQVGVASKHTAALRVLRKYSTPACLDWISERHVRRASSATTDLIEALPCLRAA